MIVPLAQCFRQSDALRDSRTHSKAEFGQARMIVRTASEPPVKLASGFLDRHVIDTSVSVDHQARISGSFMKLDSANRSVLLKVGHGIAKVESAHQPTFT
jgi:hypothetical protein